MNQLDPLSPPLQELGERRWQELYPDRAPRPELVQLMALSDFAWHALQADPSLGDWLNDAELASRDTPAPFEPDEMDSLSDADCFRRLRHYRRRYWVKVAWLDLVAGNPIADSIEYVSRLSEALIDAANRWAFCQVAKLSGEPRDKNGEPLPMLVLGMGKLGGGELNYSSDIDLIFIYPENVKTQGARREVEAQVFYTKVAQKLIAALDQNTADGQVFRVDMRLRPFGDSGPLVMSFNAIEDYYQEQGREWERYAMLKARFIGSPNRHWDAFYALLRPFVYRRYIDFSVIDSLRKMKTLIAQEVRRKGLTNNIKLGAGGIREVEFVVQALQMIRGGRDATLRTQSLLAALAALRDSGVIGPGESELLAHHYLVLRRIEQYLQEFGDKQTQTLPDDELNRQRLIHLMQCKDYDDCIAAIEAIMAAVHTEFEQVIGFEQGKGESVETPYIAAWERGDLEPLSDLLPAPLREAWQTELDAFKLRLGKQKIGTRGRDTLDKLMPELLSQLKQAEARAEVFAMVCGVLDKIMSRTAYLELLLENPGALNQLIKLCSHSRWIGEHIAHYPILLDELIDPAVLYKPVPLSAYRDEIRQYFLRIDSEDLELQMEALRQFKQTHQLRIAAADATGVLDLMKVSDHLTALAEAIVEQAVNLAWQQTGARYGFPVNTSAEDKGFGVIAYGKTGGLELGYDSDLDLVFVHNADEQANTDGDKPVSARQFYLKLAQRLMHLFNTRTSSGILYELDTRLRPEGASGLLAINIESYYHYQQTQAWTWEHQALVRARMILGQPELVARFDEIRREILCRVRDRKTLAEEVAAMREKMRSHLARGSETRFDLKQDTGGMADIEFITQYLALAYASEDESLIYYSDNIRLLTDAARLGWISDEERTQLIDAYRCYRDLYHIRSLRQQEKLIGRENVDTHIGNVSRIWHRLLGNAA